MIQTSIGELLIGGGVCACGRRFGTTTANLNQVEERDAEGNLIFVICFHGQVIIDNRGKGEQEWE